MHKIILSLLLTLGVNSLVHAEDTKGLPFVGSRSFNFFGGTGTEMSITIDADGTTLVARHGTTASSVAYRGAFKNPIPLEGSSGLLIEGNKITSYENGKPSLGCAGETKPCTSELYPIDRPADPDISDWKYSQKEDEMTSVTTYFASLDSVNSVNLDFPYNGEQHANLTLRKKQDKTEVLFAIPKGQFTCSISESCKILVRFGNEEASNYSASLPADHSSNLLFLEPAESFLENIHWAETIKISPTIYKNGNPVFTFNSKNFSNLKFVPVSEDENKAAKEPVNSSQPVSTDNHKRQPDWCAKAKTQAELLVCSDESLSSFAAELEERWAAYRKSKTPDEVKAKRVPLKAWNKDDFQTCSDIPCLTKAYEKVLTEILPD